MANADITANDTLIKGVNSFRNYLQSEAHLIDGGEYAGILATGTHDLFKIPAGNMLVGLSIVALGDTASSGEATVQFKAKIDSAAENIGDAIGKADLAAGDVVTLTVSKIKGYNAENDIVIEMTVGVAALTGLKLFVIANYVPVKEFITAG